MCREVLAAQKRVFGRSHPATLSTAANLALVLPLQGNRAAAEELLRLSVEQQSAALGPDHPAALYATTTLG